MSNQNVANANKFNEAQVTNAYSSNEPVLFHQKHQQQAVSIPIQINSLNYTLFNSNNNSMMTTSQSTTESEAIGSQNENQLIPVDDRVSAFLPNEEVSFITMFLLFLKLKDSFL
jgi:hypothetical protein